MTTAQIGANGDVRKNLGPAPAVLRAPAGANGETGAHGGRLHSALRRLARVAGQSAADWPGTLWMLVALVRGTWYALFYRVFRHQVRIELPFFAHEAVSITGPGRVHIGRFCSVFPNVFVGLSIATLSRRAVVDIAPHCSLGGLTIRCRDRVVIGEQSMTAHSLIQDVLFCNPLERGPDCESDLGSGPIEIGSNAWVGGFCCLLPRTSVGDDAVLSWATVCLDIAIPPASLASGNPNVRAVPIDRVQRLARYGDAGDDSRAVV